MAYGLYMSSYVCAVAVCNRWTVTAEYGTPPTDPATDVVCLDHYRDLKIKRAEAAERAANAAAAKAHEQEMATYPGATCYGASGRCPNFGQMYAWGLYCSEHAPYVERASRLPNLVATVSPGSEPAVEPLLAAVPCPEDKLPSTVRSALKKALANGWDDAGAMLAIGPAPDAVHSVCFEASKDGVRVCSRHEGDGTKTLSFKSAWWQDHRTLPLRIGWRELTAALDGVNPNLADQQAMREAVLLVLDNGGDVVEIQTTG